MHREHAAEGESLVDEDFDPGKAERRQTREFRFDDLPLEAQSNDDLRDARRLQQSQMTLEEADATEFKQALRQWGTLGLGQPVAAPGGKNDRSHDCRNISTPSAIQ